MLNSVLRTSFCFWSLFVLACAALFWPSMFFGQVPAFRDAFHFYYPQAVWLDQCASQGEYFPQWQCNEALGVNVAGETTSALYYPLRIVWFLPILSVAQRFAAFVLVHLIIAGLGFQYACSRLQLRSEAGWLAGAAFALSCPVLFQHNNLVFLSSSAWLGFAIAELSCWLYQGESNSQRPEIGILACAIAMMVLAGDPHTAVNICIVAVVLAATRGIAKRNVVWFGRSMLWLAMVVFLAVGLSAVQSIDSLHWASQSYRWSSDKEIVENRAVHTEQIAASDSAAPSQLLKIMNEPTRRSASATYEFSLSPWHILTGLWPTLGGQFSPENSRAFSLLSAEGRMWIPSLFFGILPLLLLLGGFRNHPNPKYSLFLFAVIFAMLASFGNYSLGWLIRCGLDAFGGYSLAGRLPPDHYSSLYGLLVEWLPGYSVFRYPAKWSVIAAAFAVLAAAIRFAQLGTADLTRVNQVQRFVLLLSGLGLILTLACRSLLEKYVASRSNIAVDPWLGTPQGPAMIGQLLIGFSIPILVIGLLAIVRWREKNLKQAAMKRQLPVHALLAWIGLLETFIVATCWCSFVDVEPTSLTGTRGSEFVWSDVSEANITRDQWLTSSTAEASVAIADYQRAFSLGKLGLLSQHRNLSTILSIEPQKIKRLRSGLAKIDDLAATQPELDKMLAWLGVEKRLVRTLAAGKPASFAWQTVSEPKQLCEVHFNDPAALPTATVKWRWIHCGQLEIDIDSPTQCALLVRQFNDDGWHVASDRAASVPLVRDSSGLFIQCAVDAGQSKLTLQRIQWPRQLGLTISGVSLLFTLAIGRIQLRIASATRSRSK